MTQELKISIKETVESCAHITSMTALSILYDEYIKKDSNYIKSQGYLPETIERSNAYGWTIKTKSNSIRPATDEEKKIYYTIELRKLWKYGQLSSDLEWMKNNEFILELVEETTNFEAHNCKTCRYFAERQKDDNSTVGFCYSGDDISPYEVEDTESECQM